VVKISSVVLENLPRSTFINSYVNKMVAAAGLDVTKKHYTNHSIQKKAVKNLKNLV